MALDNSTIQNPLPGDLQARVENALNLITSLEAEEVRLTKFITGKKQNIYDLHEEEKATLAKLQSLKKEIPDLENTVAITKGILNEMENHKALLTGDIEEATTNLLAITQEHESKKTEIISLQKGHEEAEKDINERLANLREKEDAHESKVERLKKAIE